MAKQSFMSFVKELEEETGKQIIIDPEEYIKLVPTSFITTGSLSLDACLGLGGIPKRRITTIWGPESSGKTTLAMMLIKNCIRQFGQKTLYVDIEYTFDVQYAYQIIGEEDFKKYVVLLQPDTAEEALEILGRGIESKEFGLVILDSIGDLSPAKEKRERDFAKQDMALISKLLGKFLRIYKKDCNTNDVAVVLLNQVRANIGSYHGGYSLSGGYALKHDSSIIVRITKAGDIKIGEKIIGISVKFIVTKNKMAAPFKTSIFPIIFGTGIDTLMDLIEFSKTIKVIESAGPYLKFHGENLGLGMNKTIAYLEANPEIVEKIRQEALALATGSEVLVATDIDDDLIEDLTE